MKTLINALQGINKLGMVLVLLTATLFITQSAFTTKKFNQLYYYDNSSNQWVNAGSLHEDSTPDENGDYDPNSFRCEINDEQDCSAMFDSTSPTLPASAIPQAGTLKRGDFVINP